MPSVWVVSEGVAGEAFLSLLDSGKPPRGLPKMADCSAAGAGMAAVRTELTTVLFDDGVRPTFAAGLAGHDRVRTVSMRHWRVG